MFFGESKIEVFYFDYMVNHPISIYAANKESNEVAFIERFVQISNNRIKIIYSMV